MIFCVGPWGYRLEVVHGLCDQQGKKLMGRADYDGRTIYLCADLAPTSRASVLLHELRHAWTYHVGIPMTEEGEADLTATIAESYRRDLARQGGLKALLGMRPASEIETPAELTYLPADDPIRCDPASQLDPAEATAPARGGRAQCAACETIIADGSIVNGKTRYDPVAKGRVLTRTLFCSHCHHLQVWDEGCNPAGAPNGAVVRGPLYQRGPIVEQFLKDHPEAAGLIAS